MKRLSLVTPALFTRMSSCPIAGLGLLYQGRHLGAVARGRREGRARGAPSLAATRASFSRRVPESATVAPCACIAAAMASPMPPEAPVTSAHLPVRSNISDPLPCSSLYARLQPIAKGRNVLRVAHGACIGLGRMRFAIPVSTRPAPISNSVPAPWSTI